MPKVVPIIPSPPDTPEKIRAVREVMAAEYGKRHRYPWIIAYSGGKDSTLLLQLVFEVLLKLPPEARKREVHVVGNDTLVESPPVIEHLKNSLTQIRDFVAARKLPVRTVLTKPDVDQTFWVNVIGRGYAPPNRMFRWCTDRMKISPTNGYILRRVNERDRVILLIGARKSESQARRRSLEKHHRGGLRMSKHPSLANCAIFSPLAELDTDEVWMTLLQSPPPWGGTHRKLVTLYRNARGGGGECPLVLSKDDAPSCGTTSPRFGCWTCTVVEKDRSMDGLIDSGFDEFGPLMDFRDWLQKIRNDTKFRMETRRDGTLRYNDNGDIIYGPFKLEVRKRILQELQRVEKETNRNLISRDEIDIISHIWRQDELLDEIRSRNYVAV